MFCSSCHLTGRWQSASVQRNIPSFPDMARGDKRRQRVNGGGEKTECLLCMHLAPAHDYKRVSDVRKTVQRSKTIVSHTSQCTGG